MTIATAAGAPSTPEASPNSSPQASPQSVEYTGANQDYKDASGNMLRLEFTQLPSHISADRFLEELDSLAEEPISGAEYVGELDAPEGCRMFELSGDAVFFAMYCVHDGNAMLALGMEEEVVTDIAEAFLDGETDLIPDDYELAD